MPSSHQSDAAANSVPVTTGMQCLDTSRNPAIPRLMEAVAGLSRARDPKDVLREYAAGLGERVRREGYISISTRDLEPGAYRITRMMLDEDAGFEDSDPWRNRHQLDVHRGGFIGALIRKAYPEVILHLDIKDDPVLGDALTPFGSLMAVPLFDEGEPLNWGLMLRRDPEGFDENDLEEAILRGNLVGTAVRNVLAARELREAHQALENEIEQIRRIQRALLPKTLPTIDGLSLGANYQTFDRAGGDLYALRQIPDGRWAILIGDAAGHGPAAAVVMAMMHAIVEAYPHRPSGPAEILDHANDHLCAKNIESSFFTAFLALYDPSSRELCYARAGHPPPIRMHKNGSGWAMDDLGAVGDLPLGIVPQIAFEESTLTLDRGQTVVFYTDGVTEALSPSGKEFGIRGVHTSLTECSGAPECVIGHVTEALRTHEGGRRPGDDQTLLVARVE